MTKENTRALLLINSIFDVEFCESNMLNMRFANQMIAANENIA